MRINRTHHTVITVALSLFVAACGAEPPPAVSRAWPVMGTMMSAAAWAADTTRLAGALTAARDSVDRIDSLITRHARIAALDSVQRDLLQRTGVTAASARLASGYALDRAARALAGVSDSALLDLGGQYLWIGPPGRVTHRTVGISDPDNSLVALAMVELRGGSIRTQPQSREDHGRARSVTVLAPDALTAHAWSLALFALGCDSALAVAASLEKQIGVVCADTAGVRWTRDLEKRVRVLGVSRPARGP
ncbi:MAG TPA: FAD:protein FMN transferase [Gemmatimonadales bacterium]|nr:FAD:protein FMN transferase [Gemmatimonadales bacterium]